MRKVTIKLDVSPQLRVIYEKKNVTRHLKGYVKHSSLKYAKSIYSKLKGLMKKAS